MGNNKGKPPVGLNDCNVYVNIIKHFWRNCNYEEIYY